MKHLKQRTWTIQEKMAELLGRTVRGSVTWGRLLALAFLPLSLIWLEGVVKLRAFGTPFTGGMLRTALFSLPVGLLALALCQLWQRRGALRCAGVCLAVLTGLCMIQTVYFTIFQTFASLYSTTGLGGALSDFWFSVLVGIRRSALYLLAEALPLLALWLLRRELDFTVPRRGLVAIGLAACLLQAAAVTWTLNSRSGAISPRYIYGESFVLEKAVDEFGVITTLRLDARQLTGSYAILPATIVKESVSASAGQSVPPAPVTDGAAEDGEIQAPEQQPEPEVVYGDNVLPIDFAALAEEEQDKRLQELHSYFASVAPTKQNEYTGRFAGKNLILITAEGFAGYAVNPELTPTLYRLANSGFVCTNFYNPLWWVSTYDGEYTILTSLIPKSGVWSLLRSANNALPFTLGNQFRALDYPTRAYHNHTYNYYSRDKSHPHLGYDYQAIGNGMKLPFNGWPRSDLEMMEATVPEYVNGENPFHVYYLTVSGHLEYNFMGNSMASKNRDLVRDLPMSEGCQAYLATQIELDRALESLLAQLEEAGELKNTVIALAGDHYPYGLTDEEVSEFLGHPVDTTFELYHSTMILWSGDMEEPVYIDKPCSSLDLLPTLSNLFGLPYDSRLMMGRDILSDSPGRVVLSDRSWITDLGRYDVSAEVFTPAEGVEVPEGYAAAMMAEVNRMFTYSARILEQDYYGAMGLTEGWQETLLGAGTPPAAAETN